MLVSHSWADNWVRKSKKGTLLRKEHAGRGEKDRFSVQVTITKDVKKLKLFIIFKDQPENDVRENHRSVVTHELKNLTPDVAGNRVSGRRRRFFLQVPGWVSPPRKAYLVFSFRKIKKKVHLFIQKSTFGAKEVEFMAKLHPLAYAKSYMR